MSEAVTGSLAVDAPHMQAVPSPEVVAEASPSPAQSSPAPPSVIEALSLLAPDQSEKLERLSQNLARAAMATQRVLGQAAMKPGEFNSDPFHVGPALRQVAAGLAAEPERILRAQADLFERYLDLWAATMRRLGGEQAEAVATPAKGDKRFSDPEWTSNVAFDVMKQSYLLSSEWLNGLIAEVQGVDPMTKRRVEFFTRMLTDAFAPTNFLASNPAALRDLMTTQGESLLKGAENFAADLARGGGQLTISQTDLARFKVGENVATTPGKVVFQNELFQLIQYAPTTDTVFERPLLIFPPWINKYYILDLKPENSMIGWLTSQGLTVFVVSWVNPTTKLADRSFKDYMLDGVYMAVEAVLNQTGADKVNSVGYCIGGTLLSCSLAHMAQGGYDRIASATFFATQQDFTEAGDLLLFTNNEWIAEVEKRMDAAGGVLPGAAMADTFNMLRANDLIWSYFVNNYLRGQTPRAFDLLYWNADQTRMPKALHMQYLREFYHDNKLARGELELAGAKLNLGDVEIPIFVQSSVADHISPYASVYRGARLFGGEVTFMMAGSGHIAGVVNPPAAKKYQHWVNTCETLPESVEDWRAGAAEFPGSWWPVWRDWLAARSGVHVPARDPAAGPLPPHEDAPGSYVKVRSDGG